MVWGATVGGEYEGAAGPFGDEFVEVVGLGWGEKNTRAFRKKLAPFAGHARKASRGPVRRAARPSAGRQATGRPLHARSGQQRNMPALRPPYPHRAGHRQAAAAATASPTPGGSQRGYPVSVSCPLVLVAPSTRTTPSASNVGLRPCDWGTDMTTRASQPRGLAWTPSDTTAAHQNLLLPWSARHHPNPVVAGVGDHQVARAV